MGAWGLWFVGLGRLGDAVQRAGGAHSRHRPGSAAGSWGDQSGSRVRLGGLCCPQLPTPSSGCISCSNVAGFS